MTPLSCSNCCFNGLQYGALGLTIGYCVEHAVVLRRADETTCGRQLRKDLGRESRDQALAHHSRVYSAGRIEFVRTHEPVNSRDQAVEKDTTLVRSDPVGDVAADYGYLDTKIASLAQLRTLPGIRAELAFLSLGRSYVRRCAQRGGPWTSGLHLYWWTRQRIRVEPVVQVTDLRLQNGTSLWRQAELAAWHVVMLRLNFLSDIGLSARSDESVSQVGDLVERAAAATEIPDLNLLMSWIANEGERTLEAALSSDQYARLRAELHAQREAELL